MFRRFILATVALLIHLPVTSAESERERDLALLDCAASTLGTIGSWIRNEPEAAIDAFANYEVVRKYLESMQHKYPGPNYPARIGDRMAAVESKTKAWEHEVSKLLRDSPKQIASEFKRTGDAIGRYQKAKSKRIGSIAYLGKSHWATRDKLDVLTAAGADTRELQMQCEAVSKMLREAYQNADPIELAKKNGYVRDAYSRDDRNSIEDHVRREWTRMHPDIPVKRIVMPKQAWSNTYGAKANLETGVVEPNEIDRMTVYIATEKAGGVLTLHPLRLMRQHFLINGKRLGKIGPQAIELIPCNEESMDILPENIR